MKLTQKTIAAIKLPKGKAEAIYFDDELPGFGLRLGANGQSRWVFQYKIGVQHRRITLGNFPALALAKARETAADLHAKVRLGRDPAGEKAEGQARTAETVAAILQLYLAYQKKRLRWRSYLEIERHLLRNSKPLHGTQLAKVDRRAVAAVLSTVANRAGDVTANRTRTALSAFFSWAMREGLVDSNPVIGTNRQPEKSRDRVLSDDELKLIWNTLGSDDYSTIVRLLMLTGQRADEIAALRWSEIAGDQIVLPSSRTKNKREHTVRLAPAVKAILDSRPRHDGEDFVFGRRRGVPFRGWRASKKTLDQRIDEMGGKLEHWVHHDLRRTMSTRMHGELGIPPHVVEAVINHVSGHRAGVAGIYNKATYAREKAAALARWAEYVLAVAEGRKSNVVTLITA